MERLTLGARRGHALSAQRPGKDRRTAPLRQFLKINKRVSAIIAHGTDASTFLTLFEKTYHSSLKNNGIKIYKASALGGRAFAVSETKQEEILAKNVRSTRTPCSGRASSTCKPLPARLNAEAWLPTLPAASAGASAPSPTPW